MSPSPELPPFPAGADPQRVRAASVPAGGAPPDAPSREASVDPSRNVVLEASAGTGKTTVLVTRYLNLLRAGVDPVNVLAITFTRQAAAEMRERIVRELRAEAAGSREGAARWTALKDRLGEITISTIDAFCLSLLREFPLEADLDPGFGLADDTEIPHVIRQAVEQTLEAGTAIAREDDDLAMLLAQLGPWRMRVAITHLLQRRLVASQALGRFLAGAPREIRAGEACRTAVARLADRLETTDGALARLLADGPSESGSFAVIAHDLRHLRSLAERDPARIRAALDRVRAYFLTRTGAPRRRFVEPRLPAGTSRARRFRAAAAAIAPVVHDELVRLDRDLNVAMARTVLRLFRIALVAYRRELEIRGLLDFPDLLERAVGLLRQMDEFARSRYRLESRYHHVLVDEFQDTSRAQWELVSLLVQSWGEGSGLVHEAPLPPSVFVVGDRKQSIYRFRDADVAVLDDAAAAVAALREPGGGTVAPEVRQSISNSFRGAPALLVFLNDLFAAVEKAPGRRDAFRFDARDHFPVAPSAADADAGEDAVLGVAVGDSVETCAQLVAGEVARLLEAGAVRDRHTGRTRPIAPNDIAILFRSRESHREFERALNARQIQTSVYKGLGFFDTDEIKDVRALLRYLADPSSELRAAALLRSRFIGISDAALAAMAGHLSAALLEGGAPPGMERLGGDDLRLLDLARAAVPAWVALVDRVAPAEVLDRVLAASAYALELRSGHPAQARENVKKIRGLVRRVQNRGYATMARVTDHLDHLSGDVSNAVVEAFDAVQLMTVHAAKGLEFPVVMLVDLGRGTGTEAPPVRVVPGSADAPPSVSVWPFRTAADEEERRRDLEETKRLVYVAATRARDRLYWSFVAEGEEIKVGRGSLGEVLPAGFVAAVQRAAATAETSFAWTGASGHRHRMAVVQVTE